MRKFYTVALVCAVTVVSLGFKSPEDWYLFKSARYEIAFPVEPATETRSVQSPGGEMKMDITMYDASKSGQADDNFVYMSNVTEFPASVVSSEMKEKVPKFFRGAIDSAVKNVHGKLLSETDIKIAGFPGKEFKVDFQNGVAVIKAQCFLVKNRMYLLETITASEKFPNASLDRFFSSFKVHAGK